MSAELEAAELDATDDEELVLLVLAPEPPELPEGGGALPESAGWSDPPPQAVRAAATRVRQIIHDTFFTASAP